MLGASQGLCGALPLLYTHLERRPRLQLQGPDLPLPSAPGSVPSPPGCSPGPSDSNTSQIGPSPPPPTACLHLDSHFPLPPAYEEQLPSPREESSSRPGDEQAWPRDGCAGLGCTARVGRRMGQHLPPLTPRPPGAGAVNVADHIDSHHAGKSAVSC